MRNRDARHQRHIRSADAAVGEIDRGRRLGGARYADQNHIGLFPPVKGDPNLVKAAAPYAGEKGNLRFPLDEPIPYDLIKRIVLHRIGQSASKPTAKKPKGAAAKRRSVRPVKR